MFPSPGFLPLQQWSLSHCWSKPDDDHEAFCDDDHHGFCHDVFDDDHAYDQSRWWSWCFYHFFYYHDDDQTPMMIMMFLWWWSWRSSGFLWWCLLWWSKPDDDHEAFLWCFNVDHDDNHNHYLDAADQIPNSRDDHAGFRNDWWFAF